MRTIQISSSKTQYPVYIGDGAVARLTPLLRARGKTRVFIITSPKIWAPWQRQLRHAIQSQAHVFMVQPGEKHKNLNTIQTLAEQLARGGAARDALLIAFGGGVIGASDRSDSGSAQAKRQDPQPPQTHPVGEVVHGQSRSNRRAGVRPRVGAPN